MATGRLAADTAARFSSWQSLLKAQKSFGLAQRLESHCKSAHEGKVSEACQACQQLLSYIAGEPMDARTL